MTAGWCGKPLPDDRDGWKTRALAFMKIAGEDEKERDIAVKKAAFWKAASAALRQRTVDLYDRYDNRAAETYERVFNSILDTEEDPNPAIADDERDRWLIERTWLSTLSAVLGFMPTEDDR